MVGVIFLSMGVTRKLSEDADHWCIKCTLSTLKLMMQPYCRFLSLLKSAGIIEESRAFRVLTNSSPGSGFSRFSTTARIFVSYFQTKIFCNSYLLKASTWKSDILTYWSSHSQTVTTTIIFTKGTVSCIRHVHIWRTLHMFYEATGRGGVMDIEDEEVKWWCLTTKCTIDMW